MTNTYFTSDLHFCHDREFIWGSRGFDSCDEMNNIIIERWNNIITDNDIVFVLGDLMLGDLNKGLDCLNELKGDIFFILGNHDTDKRIKEWLGSKSKKRYNMFWFDYAKQFKAFGYNLFLTHYPCLTGSLEVDDPKKTLINLYGHTHQKTKFYEDRPFMYHVGMDAHNCTPVNIEQIIFDINEKYKECKQML